MTSRYRGVARVAAPPVDGSPFWQIWIGDTLESALSAPDTVPDYLENDLVSIEPDDSGSLLITGLLRRPIASSPDVLRWRIPDENGKTRMWYLRQRDRIEKRLRGFFENRDFLHIQAPLLVPAPNPEPQFDIISAGNGCLITSPELQLKRMLTGGFERIWSLVPCFRGGETDRSHNPEFTMLEWYRSGAGLDELISDLEALIPAAAGGDTPVPAPPWPRITVADLVRNRLGLDISGCTDAGELHRRGRMAGLFEDEHAGEPFEVLFTRLWSCFEEDLGGDMPLFITHWPLPLASLAAVDPDDPSRSLRMELVWKGVELANGFAELTDPVEQRLRMEADVMTRARAGLPEWGTDELFLGAVDAGLPEAAGMALGFDRLCMLLTGAPSLRTVLPFSRDEL